MMTASRHENNALPTRYGMDPDLVLLLSRLDQGVTSVFASDTHVHEFMHDAGTCSASLSLSESLPGARA
jgi:hypothetical protein